MWPDIMARVCGRDPLTGFAAGGCQPSWLDGHARHPVLGQDYPGLVVDHLAPPLRGVLYRGITPQEWVRLDAFEGLEYERVQVWVRPGTQVAAREPAWAYRFRDEFVHRLGPGAWSEEAFAAEGKARFCARYIGFRQADAPT